MYKNTDKIQNIYDKFPKIEITKKRRDNITTSCMSSKTAVAFVRYLLRGQGFMNHTRQMPKKAPNANEVFAFLQILLDVGTSPVDLARILETYMKASNMEVFYLYVRLEVLKLSESRGKVPDNWLAQLVSENSNFSDFAALTVTRKMTDSDFIEAVGIPPR